MLGVGAGQVDEACVWEKLVMDESAEVLVGGDEDPAGGGGEVEELGVGGVGRECMGGECVVALLVEPEGCGESGAAVYEEFHVGVVWEVSGVGPGRGRRWSGWDCGRWVEVDGDGVLAGGADSGGAFVADGFGALGLGDGEVVEAVVVGFGQAGGVGRDDDVAVGSVEALGEELADVVGVGGDDVEGAGDVGSVLGGGGHGGRPWAGLGFCWWLWFSGIGCTVGSAAVGAGLVLGFRRAGRPGRRGRVLLETGRWDSGC